LSRRRLGLVRHRRSFDRFRSSLFSFLSFLPPAILSGHFQSLLQRLRRRRRECSRGSASLS
jgi:hypothetical protein